MAAQSLYKPQQATYGMEVFTPPIAARILSDCNIGNRPIRKRSVDFLASEMSSGSWQPFSADAICFDRNGNLVNGQHRLSAVVQSGVVVSMLVGRNVPSDAFHVIDRGIKRSTGDDVSQLGCPNSNVVAAFVGNYLLACVKGDFDPYQMTSERRQATKSAKVTDFVENNFEACAELGKLQHFAKVSTEPRYILATFLHLHMSGVSLGKLREFMKMINPEYNGDVSNNHPARALSRTLLSAKLGRVRLSFGEIAEFTIRAFNDMESGEVRQQKYHKRGVTPEVKVRG
jgi:hypothetical protein